MAAPVFNLLDDNPTFTENSASVTLDNDATISDADITASTPFTGAVLTLVRSIGANVDDVFSATGSVLSDGQVLVSDTIEDPENPGNFIVVDIEIGTYTNADGTLVMTFNDQATAARISAALQALKYANENDSPPASVTINYSFDNGEVATGSIAVTITAFNDFPFFDNVTPYVAYRLGTTQTLSPAIIVTDRDSPTLSGATVSILSADATDLLTVDVGATGISASYLGGVLTLGNAATVEQYRQVLATVAYSSSAPDPTFGGSNASRTLLWMIDDGAAQNGASTTLEFPTTVDLDASGAGSDFASGYIGASAGVAIADTDSHVFVGTNPLVSLSVVLTNAKSGDTLFFDTAPPGSVTLDTSVSGQITLSVTLPSASAATAEQVLESVRFANANANLDATPRQFDVRLQDTLDFSNAAHVTLNITANGSSADDTFNVPAGTSAFNGSTGIDTANFGFRLVDATVTYSGNSIIVDSASSHTVLTGIERFAFADGTVDNADGNPLVDDLFYYSRYHDVWNVHADADAHFNSNGWHENRDPNAFFSTSFYLFTNSSVKAANINPLIHFDSVGWKEGWIPSLTFDPAGYLAAYPDVKAAGIDPLAHFLQNGAQEGRLPVAPTELLAPNGFDYVYYLRTYADVAAAGVDPFQHFQTVGWKEGRNPNALFDTAGYLATYGDVKTAGINPLDHYHANGWLEGRDPSVNFDTTSYLGAYTDVAAAHVDPLAHYLDYGRHEGRSAFADGIWG